jgi:hypothetical protein
MIDQGVAAAIDEVARASGSSKSDYVSQAVAQRLKADAGAVVRAGRREAPVEKKGLGAAAATNARKGRRPSARSRVTKAR